MVQNFANRFGDIDSISMFTGSLTEGVSLPGSDEDEMIVLKFIRVLVKPEPIRDDFTDLVFVAQSTNPGFVELKLSRETLQMSDYIKNSLENGTGTVSSSKFRQQFEIPGWDAHGPCVGYQSYDFAICLFCQHWPDLANEWITRKRVSNWPSEKIISEVVNDGCLLVPIGPRINDDNLRLWRISFSLAEKRLMYTLNHTQILCYGLLKLTLKEIIEKQEHLKNMLCSYFLKTALFWTSEEFDDHIWNYNNLYLCFQLCLHRIIRWVRECKCPNYFIPQNNMFSGKIKHDNNMPLIWALNNVMKEGINVFSHSASLERVTPYSNVQQEADLDLLVLRCMHSYPFDDKKCAYKALISLTNKIQKEKQGYIHDLMTFFAAAFCKQVPQLSNTLDSEIVGNIIKYRKFREDTTLLQYGTKTDCVSGWLFLASHLYKHKKFKDVLVVTEYLLSVIKPNMLSARNPSYTEGERNMFRDKVCGHNLTLIQKRKLTEVGHALFNDKSELIPYEFRLEANIRPLLMLPPLIYLNCLRFLSYFHLGDTQNQTAVLATLNIIVSNENPRKRSLSHSLTLLGVCYQLYGNVGRARECFIEAKNTIPVCSTAAQRLEGLD